MEEKIIKIYYTRNLFLIKCGKSRFFEDKLFEISELREDVEEHFSSLKVSGVVLKFQNERNLIENRIRKY